MRTGLLVILLLGAAARLDAQTIMPGAFSAPAASEPPALRDGLELIRDGSFEDGTCSTGNSAWTCAPFSICDWILDLSEIGLTNFDGVHAAFLGGYCTSPTYNRRICQTIHIDGSALSWWWLYFTYSEGNLVTVTLDGTVVFEYHTAAADHLLGWRQATAEIAEWLGEDVELCFRYQRVAEEADSYFVDFVELQGGTASRPLSFSALKSRY